MLYLFTAADGWVATCPYYIDSTQLRHATVEPWPGNDQLPRRVTLVGPTATHWAMARHRLKWKLDESPGGYYGTVLQNDLRVIRARWSQERMGRTRIQLRAQRTIDAIGLPARMTLDHSAQKL